MAANHTITYYHDSKMQREYYILKTKASNIKLVSFFREAGTPSAKNIRDTSYYGINGSYFDTSNFRIQNIAFQDGQPLYSINSTLPDATKNECGNSVVFWDGQKLGYADGITYGTPDTLPRNSGSWTQGGFGLYLGDSGWLNKYNAQSASNSVNVNEGSWRSAMLINLSTNDVYLFYARTSTTNISELRHGMMSFVGLSDGNPPANTVWKGLLLDGGRSAQLRGEGLSVYATILPRAVPQIIALRNNS